MPYDMNLCLKPGAAFCSATLRWPMIIGLFATLEGPSDDTFPPRSMRPPQNVCKCLAVLMLLCRYQANAMVPHTDSDAMMFSNYMLDWAGCLHRLRDDPQSFDAEQRRTAGGHAKSTLTSAYLVACPRAGIAYQGCAPDAGSEASGT